MKNTMKLATLGVVAGVIGFLSFAHPQAARADWDDWGGYRSYNHVYTTPYSGYYNPGFTSYNPYAYGGNVVVSPYGYNNYDYGYGTTDFGIRHPVLRSIGNALLNGWY